jgi:hypothetical protein
MANRPAPGLVLRAGDEARLQVMVRSSAGSAGLARRARIVLLAGDGLANERIAELVGVSPTTVRSWRARYAHRGLDGLPDAARSGRPRAPGRDPPLRRRLQHPMPTFHLDQTRRADPHEG